MRLSKIQRLNINLFNKRNVTRRNQKLFTQPTFEVVEVVEPIVEPTVEVVEPIAEVVEPITEVVEPITEVVEPIAEVVEPIAEVVETVYYDEKLYEEDIEEEQ